MGLEITLNRADMLAEQLRGVLDKKNELTKEEAKDGTRNQYQVEIERIKNKLAKGEKFSDLMKLAKKKPAGKGYVAKRKEQKFEGEKSPFANQMNAILSNKKSLVEKDAYGSKIQKLKERIKSYNDEHELVGEEKIKFKDVLRKSQLSQDMNKKDDKASSTPKGSR
jgi:hypothetical protein